MGACDAAAVVQHVFVCRGRNQLHAKRRHRASRHYAKCIAQLHLNVRDDDNVCDGADLQQRAHGEQFVEMSAELCAFSDKKCVVTVVKASY